MICNLHCAHCARARQIPNEWESGAQQAQARAPRMLALASGIEKSDFGQQLVRASYVLP